MQSGPVADRKVSEIEDLEGSYEPDLANDDDADDDIISPYLVFQPKYGVSVPNVDFHTFNITRKEAGVDVSPHMFAMYVHTFTHRGMVE